MKKLLLLLPCLVLVSSCMAEPAKPLPDPDEGKVKVSLNTTNAMEAGLTTDDSTSPITVNIAIPDSEETYSIELGAPCYKHSSYDEIVVKSGAYFKSLSEYHVDRLVVDVFAGKGIFFDVYSNNAGTGTAIEYHESKVESVDKAGGGVVYEYPIDSTGWMIKNNTEKNKPAFYSVTVVFSM